MKKIILLIVISLGILAIAATKLPSKNTGINKSKFYLMMKYKKCIDACNECAAVCNSCSSMILKEKDAGSMARCIQLNMECAAICTSAAQLMSLESENAKELCGVCAKMCDKCAIECEKFQGNENCKECASACKKAAKACREM